MDWIGGYFPQPRAVVPKESWPQDELDEDPDTLSNTRLCAVQAGLLVEAQNERYARSLRGGDQDEMFSHLYDEQADGPTAEVSLLVFWCFSRARLASVRLSLALS
jgi:hypothetical protein